MSFNKIILVGNLGRDPELRYTPQGTPVCSFSLATNEKRRDKSGESQDVTTWFRVTLWGKQAETASQYLTKGKPVYIEGRLRQETYTDREGKERTALEVNATDMHFIGSGSGATGEDGIPTRYSSDQGSPRYGSDEKMGAAAGRGASAGERAPSRGTPVNETLEDDSDIPF